MIIEGNWPRFVKLTLIKKIVGEFMEIFDPEGKAKLDFLVQATGDHCNH